MQYITQSGLEFINELLGQNPSSGGRVQKTVRPTVPTKTPTPTPSTPTPKRVPGSPPTDTYRQVINYNRQSDAKIPAIARPSGIRRKSGERKPMLHTTPEERASENERRERYIRRDKAQDIHGRDNVSIGSADPQRRKIANTGLPRDPKGARANAPGRASLNIGNRNIRGDQGRRDFFMSNQGSQGSARDR